MSNSTTLLDTISSTQANKEVVVNALLDAASPATLWGRHASGCFGLNWAYYGGSFVDSAATLHAIANANVTLTASTTNYLFADPTTGAVSVNTTGFPAGKVPLYSIVTGATTVTNYTDCRSYQPSATAGGGGGGSGTVTSVALSAPPELTVSGSPVTGSGTLTLTKAAQAVNSVWAGPTSGASAAPSFRALVAADLPVMGASGASHAAGAVPDPGATAGTTRFLREDGTWNVPTGSGGSSTLAALSDVNVTEGAGIDGFSLTWNNATGKWIASASGAGGTYAALTDVSLASLANNQIGVYSATAGKWKNQTLSLGPLVADTWNSSDISARMTLSSANLKATLTSSTGGNFSLVRGGVGHSSGKWVFEETIGTSVANVCGIGFATNADGVDVGAIPGQTDSTGVVLRSGGAAWANGSSSSNIGINIGQAVMVAVDFGAGLVWFRTGVGNWNNSGTANPATGTGGMSFTPGGSTYFPMWVTGDTVGTNSTLNVGGSAFSNSAPSGFSAWNSNDAAGLQPSDTNIAAPSNGQFLQYNGTKWANVTGLKVAEGSNAKQGTATLSAGSVVVSNTSVTANSRIFLTGNADGGTPGWLRVSARTAGTSFTITSSSNTDTSTVAYEIFEPA